MPRVRLRVEEETQPSSPYRVADPRAGAQLIPVLRLVTSVRVEPPPGSAAAPYQYPLPALIDTGAWISVIERDTWEPLEGAGLLEWLPFQAGETRTTGFGGSGFEYRIGRVWLSVVEHLGPNRPRGTPVEVALPAVPVAAQMILDPDSRLPYPLVLGLHLGVLDGRELRREVMPARPAPLSTDRGRQFGQEWYLESL